jgi:hypothetical protein
MQNPFPNDARRAASSETQKRQVREAIARGGETLELGPMELEERIAPKLASNHNETLIIER